MVSVLKQRRAFLEPVQIVHGVAGATFPAVAAVVGVVENGPAVRHDAQDHAAELVEGLVVQGLGWSTTSTHTQASDTCGDGRPAAAARDPVGLTHREAQSQEEHGLELVHPQVLSQRCCVQVQSRPPSSHV